MLRNLALSLALAGLPIAVMAQDAPAPKSVRPESLSKYWVMMHSSIQADVPLSGKNMNVPGCATVSFVVESNGRTSNIKVQKVEPAGDLATVAFSAAANLQFEPTMINAGRDRMFSSLIFPFNLPPDPEARTAIMQRCAIEPLLWSNPASRPAAAAAK